MYKIFFLLFSASYTLLSANTESIKLPKKTYQDLWINGQIYETAIRKRCNERYDVIKQLIEKRYQRPITVLDIGAAEGYFSFRLANDFEGTFVMIEKSYAPRSLAHPLIKKLCALNTTLDNIILLYRHVTLKDLQEIAKHEHFDVILCLNVLHHVKENEQIPFYHAVRSLGDTIIIEHPCRLAPKITKLLTSSRAAQLIQSFSRLSDDDQTGNLFIEDREKKFFTPYHRDKPLLISASKHDKHYLFEGRPIAMPYGISYHTYKKFGGCYPKKEKWDLPSSEEDLLHVYLQGKQWALFSEKDVAI